MREEGGGRRGGGRVCGRDEDRLDHASAVLSSTPSGVRSNTGHSCSCPSAYARARHVPARNVSAAMALTSSSPPPVVGGPSQAVAPRSACDLFSLREVRKVYGGVAPLCSAAVCSTRSEKNSLAAWNLSMHFSQSGSAIDSSSSAALLPAIGAAGGVTARLAGMSPCSRPLLAR